MIHTDFLPFKMNVMDVSVQAQSDLNTNLTGTLGVKGTLGDFLYCSLLWSICFQQV